MCSSISRAARRGGLAALVVLLVAGCGAGEKDNIRMTFGVAMPAPPEAGVEVAETLRDRLAVAGLGRAKVTTSGRLIRISVNGGPRTRATIRALTAGGWLAIYDWEANVVGPDGRPAPVDPAVTGGPAAGSSGRAAISRYSAVLRAAKPHADTISGRGTVYWLVDDAQRRVMREPAPARADLVRSPGTRVVAVAPGRVIVRAQGPSPDRWYVLADRPALTSDDIAGARREQERTTEEPAVAMTFAPGGERKFAQLTRELADRGRTAARGGATDAHQHFTVVVDRRIVSTPFIDARQYPAGLDGRGGALISGGLTTRAAMDLAGLISSGPLPAQLIER